MNSIYFKELIKDHFPQLDTRIFNRDFTDPTFGAGQPDEITNVYQEFPGLNDLPPLHATVLVISNQEITSNTAPPQLAICAAPTPEPTHEVCGGSKETSDTAAPMLAICAPPAPRDEPHGATHTSATPAPTDEPHGGATDITATPAPTNEPHGGATNTSATPATTDEPHSGATDTSATPTPTDGPHGGATDITATPAPVNEEPEVDFAAAAAAVQSSLSQSNAGKDVFNDIFDSGSTTGGVEESTPLNSQEKPKETLSASPIVSSYI